MCSFMVSLNTAKLLTVLKHVTIFIIIILILPFIPTTPLNLFQNATFYILICRVLHCKKPPFTLRKVAFWL